MRRRLDRRPQEPDGRPGARGFAEGLGLGLLLGIGIALVLFTLLGEVPTPRGIGAITTGGGSGSSFTTRLVLAIGVTVAVLTIPTQWRQRKARADSRTAVAVLALAGVLGVFLRDVGTWAVIALPATVTALALLAVRWRQRLGEPMLRPDRSPTPHLAASLFVAAIYLLLAAAAALRIPLPGLDL